jgi:Tfp pilus assembly protein PilN
MINLLPEREKRRLRNELWLRYGVTQLILVFIFELCATAMFLPSYFAISSNTNDLAQRLAARIAANPAGNDSAQQELADLRTNIAILKGGPTEELVPVQLIDQVLQKRSTDITIWGFAYDKTQKTFEVRGFAQTRNTLTQFRKNLHDVPLFAAADFPSSLLLKEKEIDFTMKIPLKSTP